MSIQAPHASTENTLEGRVANHKLEAEVSAPTRVEKWPIVIRTHEGVGKGVTDGVCLVRSSSMGFIPSLTLGKCLLMGIKLLLLFLIQHGNVFLLLSGIGQIVGILNRR